MITQERHKSAIQEKHLKGMAKSGRIDKMSLGEN
jgi:hypothetical protein